MYDDEFQIYVFNKNIFRRTANWQEDLNLFLQNKTLKSNIKKMLNLDLIMHATCMLDQLACFPQIKYLPV
jgi:hypothetical protein